MKDLIVTINTNTRKAKLSKNFIGINGENLQGNIIVDFENEFIDGIAYLETDNGSEKYLISMEKVTDYYTLPIKSSLLKAVGKLSCQIRISLSVNEDIEVFKSEVFEIPVLEAINATEIIPDEYPTFVDMITEKVDIITEKVENLEDNKLDKDTSTSTLLKAYIKYPNGTQGTLNINPNYTTESGEIVSRNSGGQVKVPLQPSQNNDGTSKYYVDTGLNSKQPLLTTLQQNAVDSGIDSTKVGQIATNTTNISNIKDGTIIDSFGDVESALSGKQATLSQTQQNAVDSGIDSTKVGQIATNTSNISSINEKIPTNASSSNKLTVKDEVVGSVDLSINNTTYVVTLQCKDLNGNNLGSAQTIDLPLETVVVSGSYDDTTKKVILTLQNGSTIEFSVADLVAGLQTEITSQNKLSSDLVDDTNSTNHKFVTSSEKTQITTNATNISNIKDGTTIDSFGDVESALSGKQALIDNSHKLSADLLENGTNNKVFTATEQTKLNGIENGAEVNDVNSVNGKTGIVVLDASDVGALPSNTTYVSSVKSLDTTATTSQSTNANESISGSGTITLHKVAKTGSYNDLLDKPTIPTNTNQTIKVGNTTFGADDVVELVAGNNTTIAPDATNKTITISTTGGSGTVYGWVYGEVIRITNVKNTTTTSIDMSTFITDYDANGEYELLVGYYIDATATYQWLSVWLGSDIISEFATRVASDVHAIATLIPIKKYLKYHLSANERHSDFSLYLLGYRRIK